MSVIVLSTIAKTIQKNPELAFHIFYHESCVWLENKFGNNR